MQRRPGLILIAIWNVIYGVIETFDGVRGLATILAADMKATAFLIMAMGLVILAMAVAYVVIGLLSFACAYGLWKIRPWGRQLAIGLSGARIALWLLTHVWLGAPLFAVDLIPFGISLAVITYLFQPTARDLFSREPSTGRIDA